MKRFVFFLFISFYTFLLSAQQRFVPGLKLGISTSQVHGDTYTGFHKAGVVGGVTLATNFNKKWSAQFEIIYIQKGSKFVSQSETVTDSGFYFLQLNYLEVPLLLQYHLKKFTFEVGPSFGYLINEIEAFGTRDITGIRPCKKTETSISIGISCLLFKNLGMNWRYTNSLLSIRDFATSSGNSRLDGQRNNVLAFSLIYQFARGEKE